MLDFIILPLITTIVTAVIGSLIKIFFSKYNMSYTNKSKSNDSTIAFNKVNIFITKTIVKNNEFNQTNNKEKQSNQTQTNEDTMTTILMVLTVGLILISLYLKYRLQINKVLLMITFSVVTMTLSAIYFVRKGLNLDNSFRVNMLWIVIATIFVPINLYLLENPLYLSEINKNQILIYWKHRAMVYFII